MGESKYDFFISHASEDKGGFVKEFAIELEKKGYLVWYDEFTLKIGDSLIDVIQKGIKECLFGVIVLSKNFFKKEWTKKELNALLSKEIVTKENLLLPIWLDVSYEEVFDYSPFIADRFAISSEKNSIDEIVKQLENKVKPRYTTLEMVEAKIEYFKSANDTRLNKEEIDIVNRIKRLRNFHQECCEYFEQNLELDNNMMDLKFEELRVDYLLPKGIYWYPEYFPKEVNRAIELCSEWVYGELSIEECKELYWILDQPMDTDIPYILYGFPHSSIRNAEGFDKVINGIMEIGMRNRA